MRVDGGHDLHWRSRSEQEAIFWIENRRTIMAKEKKKKTTKIVTDFSRSWNVQTEGINHCVLKVNDTENLIWFPFNARIIKVSEGPKCVLTISRKRLGWTSSNQCYTLLRGDNWWQLINSFFFCFLLLLEEKACPMRFELPLDFSHLEQQELFLKGVWFECWSWNNPWLWIALFPASWNGTSPGYGSAFTRHCCCYKQDK